MASVVEDIARRKPKPLGRGAANDMLDDGDGKDKEPDDDEDMKSYDDVEGSAMKDLVAEIGEKGANAVRDYVKACIEKASSDEE